MASLTIGLTIVSCTQENPVYDSPNDLLNQPGNAPTTAPSNYNNDFQLVEVDASTVNPEDGADLVVTGVKAEPRVSIESYLKANPDLSREEVMKTHRVVSYGPKGEAMIARIGWVEITTPGSTNLGSFIPAGYVASTDANGGVASNDPIYVGKDWEHIPIGRNKTKYKPKGWLHILGGDDNTKYIPPGYEHIPIGRNKSKYKPKGWLHILGGPNNTLYTPPTSDKTPIGN
ncbi:MAG: hypothetical protein ACFB10_11530 [Salibacteraceae bacterium]